MNEGRTSGSSGADGQFRHATVLFLDLVGYSEMPTRLDGDLEALDRISEALEQVAHVVVSRYHGLVNEVRGDGVVALFGLPGVGEGDARDAIDAALDAHRAMQALALDDALGLGVPLALHSGVHSGLVLLRRATRDHRIFRVTGDATIVAARLSDAAAAGEILVSAEALSGSEAFFEVARRTQLEIPPVGAIDAFKVLGRSAVQRPYDARLRRRLSPFVGRQAALRTLDTVLDAALQGGVHLAGIVGIAGVGKTRVAEEALGRTYAANVRVLRGYCAGLERAAPLEPFVQALRQALAVERAPKDPDVDLAARLARELPELAPHRDALLELLAPERAPSTGGDAAEQGRALVGALAATLAALSRQQALILFLDDWQWADEASGQVLAALLEATDAARIMLLVTSREKRLGPGAGRPATLIELEGFEADETRAVVRALLPGVPQLGLVASIQRQTGGVPLYIEELCQSGATQVFEDEATPGAARAEGVPHWLARLIETRFDRLSTAAQDLAAVASTVGNVVPAWLLAELYGAAPDPALLAELADAGLLFSDGPGHAAHFKHGITREVIYALLGHERRRDLHLRAAHAIEAHAGADQLEEHYEALAWHYRRAERFEPALEFAERAADKARDRAALDGARVHYQVALELLDRLPSSPLIELRRSSICRNWALVCMYGPAAGQVSLFKDQVEAARQRGDAEGEARALYFVGYLSYTLGRHVDAQRYFAQSLECATRLGMDNLRAEVIGGLGHSASARGDNAAALAQLDAALALWHGLPATRGLPVGRAYSLSCKGMIQADGGDFAGGLELIGQGLALVRDSGHQIEGPIRCFESATLMWQGRWRDAEQAAEAARRVGQRVNGPYVFAMASAMRAYARWQLAPASRHAEDLIRATSWLDGWGIHLYFSLIFAWLTEVLAGEERYTEAAQWYARACNERGAEGEHLGLAVAARALARASAREVDSGLASADVYLRHAQDYAARRASPVQAACNLACEAELAHLAGDGLRAARLLAAARGEFTRLGMDWHFARTADLHAALAARAPV
ncbi:MAG: AAA family ATPase [Gammaproteobacteria bacterium]